LSAMGGTGLGDAVLSQNYLWEALPYPQQTPSIPPPPTLCHAPAVHPGKINRPFARHTAIESEPAR
jgi:hypothetical protein